MICDKSDYDRQIDGLMDELWKNLLILVLVGLSAAAAVKTWSPSVARFIDWCAGVSGEIMTMSSLAGSCLDQ